MKIFIVGGLGRVGLAFAAVLSTNIENEIHLYDINEKAIQKFINEKKASFYEPELNELLQQASNIFISSSLKDIELCDYIVITIGTNVDECLNPKIGPIFKVINDIIPYIRSNEEQTLILRSTLYPGTTKKIEALLERNGLYPRVAFCPERVATSKMISEIKTLPQIVSANNSLSKEYAEELFNSVNIKTLDLFNTTEGELAKLFTNAYRYIKFAVANKFYMIAKNLGCDYTDIHNVMKNNYPRMKDFPRPGWTSGSCLRKDTLQLAAYDEMFIGNIAERINESLPLFVFREIREEYGDLFDKTVGILGMSFKGDTDDIRDSLAYRMKKILTNECKQVLCTDPYDSTLYSLSYVLKNSDILILMANHKEYKKIQTRKPLIDISGFTTDEYIDGQ